VSFIKHIKREGAVVSRISTEPVRQKPVKSSATRVATGKKYHKPADGLDRHHLIATAAYYRAEHRGFTGEDPVEDWLVAEAEIERLYH
jgi:hypothetical protein